MSLLAMPITVVLGMTLEKHAFIEEHPVIRIGVDPGFVPFSILTKMANNTGIAADYLSLISEKTGLQFEVVQDLTWPKHTI